MRASSTNAAGVARERHKGEQHTSQQLREIVETLPIPVLIATDPECHTITANAAAHTLFRLAGKPHISKSGAPDRQPQIRLTKDGSELAPAQTPMREAIEQRKALLGLQQTVILGDETEHQVLMNVAPLIGEDGKAYGAVAVLLDMTERNALETALKKSEERFYKAFQKSPMAISITSALDHHYIEVNETYERMTGYSRKELLGVTPFDVNLWVDPNQRLQIIEVVRKIGSVRDVELEYRRKDGAIRSGVASGELIDIGGEPCMIGVVADITELKAAQELADRENAFSETLFDAMPGLIFVIDEHGDEVRWAHRKPEIQPPRSSLYADAIESFARENREPVIKGLRAAFKQQRVEFECELTTVKRESVPFYFTGETMQIGAKRYAIGIGIDISARKRAERDLLRLSEQLITVHEAERSYLARELHDDTSQELALLAIRLESLALSPPRSKVELKKALMDLHVRVTELASEIHAMSRRLHPSVLDRLGIVAAIRGMCEQVRIHRGIAVAFHDNGIHLPVSNDIALCVYRIAEEAITNAIKHGEATEVEIELGEHGDGLQLRVRDNGRGFDVREAVDGLGFLSMRERLRLVAGKLYVDSENGRGTRIDAYVPLPHGPE